MGRFGCGAILKLGHFDTGPFWEVGRFDPHPCEAVWLSFFYTKTFFFLIINITNRNKKQTEGVILFPQLLCKKVVVPFVFTVPSSTLYQSV